MTGAAGKPSGRRLAGAFLAHVRVAAVEPAVADEAALERALAEAVAAAAASWPGVRVEPERFAAYLGARSADGVSLAGLFTDDLYLACACAAGGAEALRTFDRLYLDRVDGFVRRFDGSAAFVDEVRQTLRRRLFVAEPDRPPKIEEYSGRGALSSWIAVVAQRAAVTLLRGRRPDSAAPEELLEHEISGEADPELQYLRARYRGEFRAALETALAVLPGEERALLRLYYVGGLSLEKLARLHKVSFATVSRRLERARAAIASHMKGELEARLDLGPTEYQSLARLVRSTLEPSLFKLLHELGAA
jgi:RNA polymerase sigma-70 factor (ECF subfamily)